MKRDRERNLVNSNNQIKNSEDEPEYLGENTAIRCRIGRCQCGNIVRSYHNFCFECGIKLEWGNVHG